jgi:hypothetical protein
VTVTPSLPSKLALVIRANNGGIAVRLRQLSFFIMRLCFVFSVILIAVEYFESGPGAISTVINSTKENNHNDIIK